MGTQANLAERDQRLERTRAAMKQEGLDALLVAGKGHWWTGRGYLRYFTDFHMWGHDGLLLIPLDGEPMMTFSSYAVAERIAKHGWITDTAGDVYIAPKIVDEIKKRGLAQSKIGVAGHRFIIAAGTYQYLIESLPEVDFVSGDDLMDRVRMIRSPLEIQQIRELWTLSKAAMECFVEILEPGKSQRELAAEASRLALAGGARDILVFIGERPDDVNPPRDVPLQCDDIVRYHMEILGEDGHWSEITVNCAYREPTELGS